jgi:hypothetical protein
MQAVSEGLEKKCWWWLIQLPSVPTIGTGNPLGESGLEYDTMSLTIIE